ncbi:MAG: DUF4430 domain-containing protein [Lachnospiraceae bacterium]|nr:DUF4430 domain-containing protein [Lachnospiraceae bacterium]
MKQNGWRKRIRSGILAILLALLAIPAVRAESSSGPAERYEEGILSCLCSSAGTDSVQAWLDQDAGQLGKHPLEWYFLALYQGGKYDFTSFAKQYRERIPTEQTKVANATWLNRMMTAWLLGKQVDEAAIKEHVVSGDLMSLVYGLHFGTLTGTPYAEPSELLGKQCEDGGWSLKGDFGDPDVTSMVLEALAPYCGISEVKEAADRGVSFLSACQLENGGYKSFGSDNCESASQVIIALCSLGIDPMTDPRFQKNGNNPMTTLERFRNESGAFCHTEGSEPAGITSAEVLCALTSYKRLLAGQTPLYVAERSSVWGTDDEPSGKTEETKPDGTDGRDETPSEAVKEGNKAGSRFAPYQFIVSAVILGLLVVTLLILWRKKRLTKKNVLCPALLAAGLIILTFCTRIESVDRHYTGDGKKDAIGEVTLTIRCDTIAGEQGAPDDAVILPVTKVKIGQGDTAFDVLNQAAREYRIQMDYTGSGGSVYVKGIAGLYEFAYGSMSGWIYRVNGEIMPVGCGQAEVAPGDEIEFLYTRNLGEDLK